MLCEKRTGLLTLAFLVIACTAARAQADELAETDAKRIAVISGIHAQEGFAVSETVPSDRLCLQLGQNLASELGIAVHVVCTDPATGRSTIAAECGFANDPDAKTVGRYSRGWGDSADPYLICVPRSRDQYRAKQRTPDLEALKP